MTRNIRSNQSTHIKRRFHFYPLVTMVSLTGLVVLLSLGTWQLQRRTWKLDLISKVEERVNSQPISLSALLEKRLNGEDVLYTPVFVTGQFDHAREAHIFGTLGPIPGYYIFTPLIDDQTHEKPEVYINRGFVPQAQKKPDSRQDGQIEGIITVTGLFREAEERTGIAKLFTPTNQPAENIWYIRAPEHFYKAQNASKIAPYNWYIDSFGKENPVTLPQGNTTRLDFNNRHLEYALTWYGLALTLIGVWLAYSWRRT